MPKRTFQAFAGGGNPGGLGFQRAFRKTQVRGRAPRAIGFLPVGHLPEGTAIGMPPRRRKVMMVATRSRPVTHRMPGGVMRNGPRRVFKAQGVGPRTGGFTGIERKFYDSSLASAALTAPTDATGGEHDQSATIGPTTIPQGDGESQRDGRSCTVQSIFVRGTLVAPITTNTLVGLAGCKCYVAMVLDTQTNGALLNSEDVFKNDSAAGQLAASPMRNMQFTQRFRVLDSVEVTLQNPNNISSSSTEGETMGLIEYFNLSSNLTFKQQYSGTTETIANVTDNSVHIIAYTSNVALGVVMSYNCRARFVG